MEAVVAIHNNMNERTWRQILEWEQKYHSDCAHPSLARFVGRPDDLSVEARVRYWRTGDRPFDRHDWFVNRCGREVRYIIDYYDRPEQHAHDQLPSLHDETSVKSIELNVRCASPSARRPCLCTRRRRAHNPRPIRSTRAPRSPHRAPSVRRSTLSKRRPTGRSTPRQTRPSPSCSHRRVRPRATVLPRPAPSRRRLCWLSCVKAAPCSSLRWPSATQTRRASKRTRPSCSAWRPRRRCASPRQTHSPSWQMPLRQQMHRGSSVRSGTCRRVCPSLLLQRERSSRHDDCARSRVWTTKRHRFSESHQQQLRTVSGSSSRRPIPHQLLSIYS